MHPPDISSQPQLHPARSQHTDRPLRQPLMSTRDIASHTPGRRRYLTPVPTAKQATGSVTPKQRTKASAHPSRMMEEAPTHSLRTLFGPATRKKNPTPPSVLCHEGQSRPLSALKYELQRQNVFPVLFLALLKPLRNKGQVH